MRLVMRVLKRLLRWLGTLLGPGGGTHYDPFADTPAPGRRGPQPKPRHGAVAIAKPDE
jgi:hypothetical protein